MAGGLGCRLQNQEWFVRNMNFQDPSTAETEEDIDVDPLLGCLKKLAIYHDRPLVEDKVLAGLPLAQGRLTPALFVKAANRAGYSAKIVKRSLKQIHPIALPAVLIMEGQDACLMMAKKRFKRAQIYDPVTDTTTTAKKSILESSYTGTAILLKPEEKLSETRLEARHKTGGHWFWGQIWRLWPHYLQVILAAALINILALASPLFVMNVYDRVLPNKAISTLWVLAIGIGLAILFDLILRSVRGHLADSAGRRADVLLASRIFEHVMGVKLSNRPKTTGSFASQLKDFDAVREFFTSGTLATMTDLLFFGLFMFVIYQIGGPIAFVPATAAVIVIIVGLIMQFPLRRAAQKTQMETAYRHSLLVETIASLETVKATRSEGWLQRTWERLVGRTARTLEKTRRISSFVQHFTIAVQQLVTVGVIIIGVYLFEAGEISTGAIIACVILAGRSVAPFGQFTALVARSQNSFAALRSLNEIMRLESELSDEKNFIDQPIKNGEIEFRKVQFRYPNAPNLALDGLSLVIKPGERVGIIGKIGSGKTTIGRLLVALYEPEEGNLLMDGVDFRQYHPHAIRRAVGFVSQDSDLFFGTVRSNIMMGSQQATDDQFVEAAKLAGVDEFTLHHPAGFDMEVGERGTLLSGGQRQAVCLARVLLQNPKILFLDEPSGAMDMASERQLINHLRSAIRADQTLIVSTHRHSMLAIVDRLIILAEGKVVADGPKEKVLNALKTKLRKA